MSHPVQLYIYDLSNGMARMLSRQLTGTHFDAIYHTSVVVHGVEWFFGAGIQSASPGKTHHGAPMEVHPLGSTALDAQGVAQLVRELAPRFQASDYHLLRHNCNNFSDVLGRRLTGQGVPAHVSSLPADFLSTPFGQMMAPQIDAMFRPAGAGGATPHASTSSLGSALVQNVAESALAPASASTSTLRLGSGAAVQQLLASEPCVALLASSSGAVSDAVERIAQAHSGVAFATCDASSLSGAQAGRVSFHLSGEQIADCDGGDAAELQQRFAELQGLIWTRHPHADLALPSLAALPQSPITFTAVPSFSSLVQKLDSFVAACPAPSFNVKAALQDARKVVVKETIPWLERHAKGLQSAPAMSTTSAQAFQRAAHTLQQHLSPDQLFPLLDITRLLLLHPPFVASLAQNDKLVPSLLQRAAESESRPTVLTATRLLTNALVHPPLCTTLQEYVRQLPTALLHADAAVRSAAASASFNAGLGVSHRLPLIRLPDAPAPAAAPEDDWDVELAPALLEAAQREESDETLHRTLAALLLVLHNSPRWEDELRPMLQVLDAAEHCGTLLRERTDPKLQPLLKDLVTMCGAA